MSKFFRIGTDPDIMDVYSIDLELNREIMVSDDWKAWNRKFNLNNTREQEPSQEFKTTTLVHNPNTPLTDILDIHYFPNRGIVVSDKFLTIIKDFSLPRYATYPLDIKYRGELIFNYYYLFFIEDHSKYIDFSKTYFVANVYRAGKKKQLIDFNDYLIALEENKDFMLYKFYNDCEIIFKNFDHDIFCINRVMTDGVFVTEKLKTILEENTFGIRFKEYNKLQMLNN